MGFVLRKNPLKCDVFLDKKPINTWQNPVTYYKCYCGYPPVDSSVQRHEK